MLRDRFTLLQGPPGTGKTDFIARTVIALALGFLAGWQKELELAVRYAMLLQDRGEHSVRSSRGGVSANSVQKFWHEQQRLGIVSPMHAQIEAIRARLCEETEAQFALELDGSQFCIGTVDALQGQERDSVIISYGVSDPAQAPMRRAGSLVSTFTVTVTPRTKPCEENALSDACDRLPENRKNKWKLIGRRFGSGSSHRRTPLKSCGFRGGQIPRAAFSPCARGKKGV